MRVTGKGVTELRPREQDGASDNQGWVRSSGYQRGVCCAAVREAAVRILVFILRTWTWEETEKLFFFL